MTKEAMFNKYRLLDETEFAEITGMSVATLRTMRSRPERGGPPWVKQGRAVRYTLASYEKWLEKNTTSNEDIKRAP